VGPPCRSPGFTGRSILLHLLVYTWRWDSGPAASKHESLVTVTFDDLGHLRTKVTLTHDRFPPDHDSSPYRSGREEGLDNLDAAILEGNW
jgi:uncharacterized protein YndB with AHSA1/START domain